VWSGIADGRSIPAARFVTMTRRHKIGHAILFLTRDEATKPLPSRICFSKLMAREA
jgi:hypothetical protein